MQSFKKIQENSRKSALRTHGRTYGRTHARTNEHEFIGPCRPGGDPTKSISQYQTNKKRISEKEKAELKN